MKVHTDSEFLVNAMTKWLQNWKKDNWRKANSDEMVTNRDKLVDLDQLINFHKMKVTWVRLKHASHFSYGYTIVFKRVFLLQVHIPREENKEADKLAKEGAK